MNNDVFNFNRFGRYLVTDIRNAVSKYGITLLVMASFSITIYLIVGMFSAVTGNGWISTGLVLRVILFGLATLIVLISSPSKIYGFITDKKEGTSFLMVPVSTLEKTLSMLIVSCIVVPFSFFAIYLSLDQILCLMDPGCGDSVIYALNESRSSILDGLSQLSQEFEIYPDVLSSGFWVYLDDIAQTILTFLLGALLFKTAKPAKTIGCIMILSIVMSMIMVPVISFGAVEKFKVAVENDMTPQELFDSFPVLSWMFRHALLVDTITDTVVNLALSVGIYFRVKKIKH